MKWRKENIHSVNPSVFPLKQKIPLPDWGAEAFSVSAQFSVGCQQFAAKPGVLCDSGLVGNNMG